MLGKLSSAFEMLSWSKLRFTCSYCPVCCRSTPIIRLVDNEIGVRCLRCGSSAITMSMVDVLRDQVPELRSMDVYEMSSRGPLFEWLKHQAKTLVHSEFFENIPSGESNDGTLCQDVQNLSFPDSSFDVCTSTEVFEHVPDDVRGFAEVCRVLKPGGRFVFTVPLCEIDETQERARLDAKGEVEHLMPPEYHLDPIRQHREILAFRSYGHDIRNRLVHAGFSKVKIERPAHVKTWGHVRSVIVACKPA